VADSQIVYYKQLRGGQMEVWLARYLDDSKRSVPVPQKRFLTLIASKQAIQRKKLQLAK